MPFFTSADELKLVMLSLWDAIKEDPVVAEPLIKSKLIVCFHYLLQNS